MSRQLGNNKEPVRMLAGVVHLASYKLSFNLGSSVPELKLAKLLEHEAGLDWTPFSPTVVCICSHV